MNPPFAGSIHSCGQKLDLSGDGSVMRRTRRFRPTAPRRHTLLIGFLAVALLAAIPRYAAAQATSAQSRITARVDDRVVTTLHGNTHPLARPANDRGAVADSLPMHRMLLLLQRGPDQETALRTLIDQQQSKSSPNYHQWLTPQQFGQQFGPSDADIQTVTSWLTSHGFQVAKVSTGRTVIEFSGTAGQVNNAFHTAIHTYSVNGKQYYANNADPQIPTALTPVVAGAVSLHNFPRKPQSHVVGTFRKTTATGQVTPLNPHTTPLYTFGCANSAGNASTCNALGPGDFATIYNIETLWNQGVSGTKIDGTGQTIAIVGDSEICTQNSPDWNTSYIGPNGTTVTCNSNSDDVATFRSLFGLPPNPPNVILDGPDPGFNGDETEGDLDVQWSGAVAKNATIDFVIAENTEATAGTDLASEYVVDNNLAPILSESFGQCEQTLGSSQNEFEATLWEQAAAQGITVIVSAGDSGSAGCDDPNTQSAAQNGPAVNGIASTPFNVALGGTDFDTTATGYQSSYWGSNTTDANGTNDVSATSYIPETTWNDSCAQNFTGVLTGCTTLTNGGIVGGGGGQSNCSYQDTSGCYYYPKPAWQTVASGSGLTAANDITRDLPDVSLFAADGYVSNSFYVVCEADYNLPAAPCSLATNNFFDFIGVGGTSSAAPTFAGMMALVNQNMAVNHPSMSARQGNANYVLYNLASKQTPSNCNSSTGPISSCTFNDVTKGNNSVPCFGGTFSCSNTSTAANAFGVLEPFDFSTGIITGNLAWNTAAGFDLATGLGSVNAYNLVTNWPMAVGKFISTTPTLCLSTTTPAPATCTGPISITHGQTVYVNMTVNYINNGVPTPIPVSENFNSAPQSVEDVALVGTFPGGNPSCNVAGCNTGGVDHFTSNNYVISNANIYPLMNGTTVGLNYSTNALVGGTYNVIAHYAGDGTYGASDSTSPISVTVAPEASTASVSVGTVDPTNGNVVVSSSVPYGYLNLVRVDVVGAASGQETATGTVTLTDNNTPIVNPTGSTSPSFSLNTEGYLEDQTAFLVVGSHSFVAKYNGDASYMASSNSAAVALTVTQAATTTTVTTSATTIASTANIMLTAFVDTLSQGANPTGTVSFFNNGALIGTVPNNQLVAMFDTNGFDGVQAVLTTKLSASGSITATYSGDTNYTTSTSTGVSVTVTVTAPLSVTTTSGSLPIGVVSKPYPSTQLSATGGVSPYTWTVTAGSLPTGFGALPTTGLIGGTPSASGAFPFTVQVKDSLGNVNTANLTITINASLAVTPPSLQSSIVAGVAYPSTTLAATGGITPYVSWVVSSGSLPAGLTLSNGGVLSGTPTAASVSATPYTFTAKVTDTQGNTAISGTLSITVIGFTFAASAGPINISTPGQSGTQLITVTEVNGFTGTVTLSCAVTPPSGVDLPTCSFTTPGTNFTAPNIFTFSGSATTATATLNVASTAASVALFRPTSKRPSGRDWPLGAAMASMVCFLLMLRVPKQRRWAFAPLAVLLVMVAVAGVGCGGGGTSGGGGTTNPGTTVGAYTITVTATPTTGAAQTTMITVNVQ